jgi:hypothetical protein
MTLEEKRYLLIESLEQNYESMLESEIQVIADMINEIDAYLDEVMQSRI